MRIDLSSVPSAMDHRFGLPCPNWPVIGQWIEEHVGEECLDEVWTDIAQQWLEQLGSAMPYAYAIKQSEHFLLLSPADEQLADRLLRWCERSRKSILSELQGVGRDEGNGKFIVLALGDHETFYDYIAEFYPETGDFGPTSGVFVDPGYRQVVLCVQHQDYLQGVVAHELTHAMLRHLPLPLWLNEGVTQVMEGVVTGHSHFHMDRELADRHRSYWNRDSIHDFWSGRSFFFANEGQELSYNLAEVLVRNLIADYPGRILDFLNAASLSDAGEQGLVSTCGVSLNQRAAQFLGAGEWRPMADYGQSDAEVA